jgi:hypothetical protein
MKYLEAIFYIWFGGGALLLLFKLLVAFPGLAVVFGLVLTYMAWELFHGPRA